jgi:hypothetical protein
MAAVALPITVVPISSALATAAETIPEIRWIRGRLSSATPGSISIAVLETPQSVPAEVTPARSSLITVPYEPAWVKSWPLAFVHEYL